MRKHIDSIPGGWRDGAVPIPDWDAVSDWVEGCVHCDAHVVWHELAHEWLERIAAWRPAGLHVSGHADFLLLSPFEESKSSSLLRFMQSCRVMLCETLPDLVLDNPLGPFVGMVFRDADEYYDYTAEYFPEEGEFGGTAGIYLDGGYGHFVVMLLEDHWLRHTVAHEIVHAHLVAVNMPLWLEEGLTQTMTDRLTGYGSSLDIDREMLSRQRSYWLENGLNSFWSGEAFTSADDGQQLAYQLAHVTFVREMMDRREQFLRFIASASREDGGASAAVEHLGVTREELIAKFLGPEFLSK